MAANIEKQLEKLDKPHLIEIITAVACENTTCKKLVNTLLAMHDPKLMSKELNKEISAISRSSKFIDYYHAAEFANKLYAISNKIDKYLAIQAPDLAFNLCKKLIDMDNKIFERVDDSGGDVGDFYTDLLEVLDKALAHSSSKPSDIVDYIIELVTSCEYGTRSYITKVLNLCLTDEVNECFKKRLSVCPMSDFDCKNWEDNWDKAKFNRSSIEILKKIADKNQDVDEYIKLCELSGMSDDDICEIASRLNGAFRSLEAIEWLENVDDKTNNTIRISRLLQDAHHLEGNQELERMVIWERFEATLSPDDYAAYLKLTPLDEQEAVKNKAYDHAIKNSPSLEGSLSFLQYLGDYDAIEDLLLSSINQEPFYNYSFYRKLSTTLYQNNKPLSATLIRRKLIDDVLNAAKSKYYRYAISDLNQAVKFASEVIDWKLNNNHEQYMQTLKQKHFRKYSFWEQLE